MKADRKTIWDYLKSIGIELTIEQHNRLKELIQQHDDNSRAEYIKLIKEMQDKLTLRNRNNKVKVNTLPKGVIKK